MKKFLWIVVCATLCTCLVGCSDDDDPNIDSEEEQTYEWTFSISPADDIVFPAEGGSVTIEISTNLTSWDAISSDDWCIVEIGDGQFTVSAEANEAYEALSATVTVYAYDEGVQALSSKLQVTQEAAVDNTVDLSASGTSNCYLITAPGDYSFDATVRGNGATTDGLDAPAAVAGQTAAIVWQSAPSLISDVFLEDGAIHFSIAGTGNAVLAALDSDGTILWSWHIWYPEAEVADLYSENGYYVMNMNLGAMNGTVADAGSYGMLYQWGRKDPFPAAATLTGDTSTVGATIYDADGEQVYITNSSWYSTTDNTLEYAIANPTVCLSNYSQYSTSRDWLAAENSNDALWGNPYGDEKDDNNDYTNKGSKSIYDPCPVGYRVPPVDVFRNFTTSGGYAWTIEDFDVADLNGDGTLDENDFSYGWIFNLSDGVTSYFPAAARFDGSYGMLYGSVSGLWGSYWGNAPYTSSSAGLGFAVLSFQNGGSYFTVSANGGGSRADAYSIRCIKE